MTSGMQENPEEQSFIRKLSASLDKWKLPHKESLIGLGLMWGSLEDGIMMLSFAWKFAKIGAVDVEHSKKEPTRVDDAIPLAET